MQIGQSGDGSRFRLRGGFTVLRGHYKPEKTPQCGSQNPKKNCPANQNFAERYGSGGSRRLAFRGEVSAAVRAEFRGSIDFGFALGTDVHRGSEIFKRYSIRNVR